MVINNLLSHPARRKIFGEKELHIIRKQLHGIRLTQSERNRLSRDIRPKLRLINDCAPCDSRLRFNSANRQLMNRAVATIRADRLAPDVLAVLLFGSFADSTNTWRSDIDIAVVFEEDISAPEATRFRMRIAGQLPGKVDVQAFNNLPQKVRQSIAVNHRVLFSRSGFSDKKFTKEHVKNSHPPTRHGRQAG